MIRSTFMAFATRSCRVALMLGAATAAGCAPDPLGQNDTLDQDAPSTGDSAEVSARSPEAPVRASSVPRDPREVIVGPARPLRSRDAGAGPADADDVSVTPGLLPTELVAGVMLRGDKVVQRSTWLNPQRASDQRCGRREVGPCVVYDCRGSTGRAGHDRVTGVDLGPVFVAGDAVGLAIYPDGDGRYAPAEKIDGLAWAPGEVVRFRITGGAMAAPAIGDLRLPPALARFTPQRSDGAVPVDRSARLPVGWDPVEGEVAVVIRETDGTATSGLDDLTVLCAFPGVQEGNEVPAEALQSLLPSTSIDRPRTTMMIGRRASKDLMVGMLPVRLSLFNGVELPVSVR